MRRNTRPALATCIRGSRPANGRNPAAAILRAPDGRFQLRRKPSARLYHRHPRHRRGRFAPVNFGWT
ncbi:MAG: hypothetical protein ACREFK_04015 [Stellaceae bacterium]